MQGGKLEYKLEKLRVIMKIKIEYNNNIGKETTNSNNNNISPSFMKLNVENSK